MLQENYFEFMVKKKTTMKDLVIRSICLFVFIYFVTLGFMVMPIFWLGCVATWIIYKQFIYPLTDVEYEYLLCDRQITVDKIMGQAKRKQLGVYDVGRIEIMAPENSHRLDPYAKKECKINDFSGGLESKEYGTFIIFYEGNQKIVLDLPEEFVKMIQNCSPRKVFTD